MPKKKKTRITGYYRVSTKSEAQKSSFEFQPAYFQLTLEDPRFRDTHERVEKFYCDYGISGTGFLNRDGFIEMLKDAGLKVKKNVETRVPHPDYPDKTMPQITLITSVDPTKKPKFDEIWCKSTSRFARNINAYDILHNLRRAKVYVYFIDKDLHTKNDKDMDAIMDCIVEDRKYSLKVSRDTRISRENFKRQNRVSGDTFGYDYHKVDKTKLPYYTIHPEHSITVQKIFEYCVEGLGFKAISKRLAKEKRFYKNGKPLCTTTIGNILKNEKYMGYNTAGKFTTGTLNDKLPSPIVVSDYKERLRKTDALPAIVSEELWYAAQEAKASRRFLPENIHSKGTPQYNHEYKNKLFCGYCGKHFIYDNNGGNGFFKCSTKRNHKYETCQCNNVFKTKLDAFIEELQNGGLHYLIETDFNNTIVSLITLIEFYLKIYKDPKKIVDNQEKSEQIRTELDTKIQLRTNLLSMISSSTFSESGFAAFKEQIETLEIQIRELENSIETINKTPTEIEEKLKSLFEITFEEIKICETKKEIYSKEEVLSILTEIKVYGKTQNYTGGKPPEPILVPLIDVVEKATGLIKAGYTDFEYKIKDAIPNDYEAPLHFIQNKKKTKPIPAIHPIDDPTLTKEEREPYFKYPTKGKMPVINSPIILENNAFYTPEGEVGYIKDIGLENKTIVEQLKDYTIELYQEYQEFKQNNI